MMQALPEALHGDNFVKDTMKSHNFTLCFRDVRDVGRGTWDVGRGTSDE